MKSSFPFHELSCDITFHLTSEKDDARRSLAGRTDRLGHWARDSSLSLDMALNFLTRLKRLDEGLVIKKRSGGKAKQGPG